MQKLTISELVFIVVMSSVMGIFWWAYTFLYDIVSPFLKVFALDGSISGIWLMGGVFFPYIIRKPFSALLGEAIAGVVEALISQWGFSAIVYGVMQGLPVELFFLCLRYRKWDLKTMCLAGFIAALFNYILSFFWYEYYKLNLVYNSIELVGYLISGIVLAGWLSKFIADKLFKVGVLNQFNIACDSLK